MPVGLVSLGLVEIALACDRFTGALGPRRDDNINALRSRAGFVSGTRPHR